MSSPAVDQHDAPTGNMGLCPSLGTGLPRPLEIIANSDRAHRDRQNDTSFTLFGSGPVGDVVEIIQRTQIARNSHFFLVPSIQDSTTRMPGPSPWILRLTNIKRAAHGVHFG